MPLSATLIAMAAFAVIGVFCGWRGARPPNFVRGPRMVPWRWLMLLCAAAELVRLIHLASFMDPAG